MTVKRYNLAELYLTINGHGRIPILTSMEESPTGAWVSHDEYVAAVNDGWTKLSDQKPPSGCYVFYHPAGEFDGCRYAAAVCSAFWDADDGVARGEYHGPIRPTHWRPEPKPPKDIT